MKHLILAAALLGATATTSLAQSAFPAPPTATQVQALKQDIVNKIADLQANVTANKKAKAETAAADLLRLMKRHVAETRYTAEANTGATKEQILSHMLALENYGIAFTRKINDVMGNSADLLTIANDYVTNF